MPKETVNVVPQVGDRPTRILRKQEVKRRLGYGVRTIDRKCESDPTFPKKIKIGARAVGFYEADVEAYLAGLRSKGEA